MIKNKTTIIAEAGVNHNGNIKLAKKLIDAASKIGADYIKFQTFKAEDIVTRTAPKAKYQKENFRNKDSQYLMLKKLELSEKDHILLKKYCLKKKIKFLSSPFDINSFNFLKKIGQKIIKIPSGEINNIPFLEHVGKYNMQIILSTGMSFLSEIRTAVRTLIKAGTRKNKITVLHCNTEYPSPIKDLNLKAMITIKNKLGVSVGYSDHSEGIVVPLIAVSLGAKIIEKHFTINKNFKGPDHKASLDIIEFEKMVKEIRNTEIILGSETKKPSSSEKKNIKIVRKSIFAKKNILVGNIFSKENICIKRPGNGLQPKFWKKILGKKSKYRFKKDKIIKL
jgi:N,N'-diacetyllegionaminate synthase